MIDIHSHLIPQVDDGSDNIKDTIEIIKTAKEKGFTDIILTSHYIQDYLETDASNLIKEKEKIQNILNEKKIDVNLYTGMEIYISDELEKIFKEKKLLTLANSNYMLIELPLGSQINYLEYIVKRLKENGITTIIAHPERYSYVQENPKLVEEYIKLGCKIQCNYGSILNVYGKEARETLKFLLKENHVDFLASDCHKFKETYKDIPKAIKQIKKIIGEEKFKEISQGNQEEIIKFSKRD